MAKPKTIKKVLPEPGRIVLPGGLTNMVLPIGRLTDSQLDEQIQKTRQRDRELTDERKRRKSRKR